MTRGPHNIVVPRHNELEHILFGRSFRAEFGLGWLGWNPLSDCRLLPLAGLALVLKAHFLVPTILFSLRSESSARLGSPAELLARKDLAPF